MTEDDFVKQMRALNEKEIEIAVLKEIAVDYSGKTINNIIQQLESIKKEVEND